MNLKGLSDAQLRLYAVGCARRVAHLMDDPRSITAIDVAERHALGQATDEELEAALQAALQAAFQAQKSAKAKAKAAAVAAWAVTVFLSEFAARWAAAAATEAAAGAAWDEAKAMAENVTWAKHAMAAALEAEREAQARILESIRQKVRP